MDGEGEGRGITPTSKSSYSCAPEKSEATTNLQIVKLLQDRKRDLSRATGKLDNIIGKENKSREKYRVEEKETGHFFRKYYFPN